MKKFLPGMLCISGFLFAFSSCRYPSLAQNGAPKTYPVVFLVPEKDHHNPIESVFYQSDTTQGKIISAVTVVFRDEDEPFFLFDWCYDAYRKQHYRRKKDIETFYLRSDSATGAIDSLFFPGTWSGTQVFHKGVVKHFSAGFAAPSFQQISNKPVIYVNTWNHLFAPENVNPKLRLDTVAVGRLDAGDRAVAEKACCRARR